MARVVPLPRHDRLRPGSPAEGPFLLPGPATSSRRPSAAASHPQPGARLMQAAPSRLHIGPSGTPVGHGQRDAFGATGSAVGLTERTSGTHLMIETIHHALWCTAAATNPPLHLNLQAGSSRSAPDDGRHSHPPRSSSSTSECKDACTDTTHTPPVSRVLVAAWCPPVCGWVAWSLWRMNNGVQRICAPGHVCATYM